MSSSYKDPSQEASQSRPINIQSSPQGSPKQAVQHFTNLHLDSYEDDAESLQDQDLGNDSFTKSPGFNIKVTHQSKQSFWKNQDLLSLQEISYTSYFIQSSSMNDSEGVWSESRNNVVQNSHQSTSKLLQSLPLENQEKCIEQKGEEGNNVFENPNQQESQLQLSQHSISYQKKEHIEQTKKEKICRYLQKKLKRIFKKRIISERRKEIAQSRPRVKGRFMKEASKFENDLNPQKQQKKEFPKDTEKDDDSHQDNQHLNQEKEQK